MYPFVTAIANARKHLHRFAIAAIVASACGSATVPAAAAAAGDAPRPETLAQLITLLREQNPQIASQRYAAAAANAAVAPARAPDNPSISIVEGPITGNPAAIRNSQGLSWSVSQNLPWPGKRALAGEVAQAQANFVRAQTEVLSAQLVAQLKSAWFQLRLLRRQVALTTDTIARLEQIKNIAQVRYAQNAAAFIDFVNTQVAQSSARNDLLGFERQAQVALAQINALIGRDAGTPLAVDDADDAVSAQTATPAVESLRAQALQGNPQLRAEEHALAAAARNVELLQLGNRPDFSASFGVNSASPPWGVQNIQSYVLQLQVTFPFWYGRKERWLLEQAQQQRLAEEENARSLRQQTLLAVDTAFQQLMQADSQVQLLRERVVEQARVAYRLALGNYGTGQGQFLEVSNALIALRAAELSLASTGAQRAQAKAALDAVLGLTE